MPVIDARRCRLIVAPRQSELAKPTASDNHRSTRPLLLILIDARFLSRLSRHRSAADDAARALG
jgi:hypothetical protein